MLDGPTRLRNAIVSGNLPITKRLLGRFPELWLNIDSSHDGWCNLHYAAYHGHYLTCFHLISMLNKCKRVIPGYGRVCDIDLVTFDNLTVFHMPLEHHHSQTLHYLLQAFSSSDWLDRKGGPHSRTPLHCCCASDFIEGLDLFIEFGADWSARDINGDTCLHICFSYGSSSCLQGLVKGIAARKTALLFKKYSNVNKGEGGPSLAELFQEVEKELSALESTVNDRGFLAFDQAPSDAILTHYKAQKSNWINSCIKSELAIREPPLSVVSSVTIANRSRLLSVSSSVTSSLANIAEAQSRSSIDSESSTAIFSASLDLSGSATNREGTSSARSTELNATSWKYLSFVPNSSNPETVIPQVAYDKRQHSKSVGHSFKRSSGQLRTPKLALAQAMVPLSPHVLEFPKGQSLKSITISSLTRLKKRNDVDHVSEGVELDGFIGLSDSSETSNTSWAAATPVSASVLSQQIFSPLIALGRHSLSANNATGDFSQSTCDEAAMKPQQFPGTDKQANSSFFTRDPSTPIFFLEKAQSDDSQSSKEALGRPHGGDATGKPALRLIIPENSSSNLQSQKTSVITPSAASIATEDVFESSPATLTYKTKSVMICTPLNRVDFLAETPEVSPRTRYGESVNSISFTRIRGE